METKEVTEQELAAAAKAPRVRQGDVEKAIREGKVTYTVLPNGRTTVCCIEIFGGRFSVTGESSCVSKENFNAAYGENFAFKEAEDKIWGVLGAVLAYRLSQNEAVKPLTYLDRLRNEHVDESAKLAKLLNFLAGDHITKLSLANQRYLNRQRDCMEEFVWILKKRLELAEKDANASPAVLGH